MTRESPTPLPDQLSHTVTRQTRARLDALSAIVAFSSFSWNGVCCDMNLLRCRYHDDACSSFVFSTDVAVFGARTLSRSRDLKRRDGLHHNTDVRSMFYVFDTLAVHVLTSMKASHRDVCGRLLRPMNGLHRHDFISVRSTPLVLISRA